VVGLVGFSQGGAHAACLARMLAASGDTSLKFVALFAGFVTMHIPKSRFPGVMSTPPPPLPALVVSGKTDHLVAPERAEELARLVSSESQLVMFDGGHLIPQVGKHDAALEACARFFSRFSSPGQSY